MPWTRIPLEERFWAKVAVRAEDECWEWLGSKKENGYGQIAAPMMHLGGSPLIAHRVSYELHFGKIPEKHVIDHLCENVGCVNPLHLEAMTQKEHTRRHRDES